MQKSLIDMEKSFTKVGLVVLFLSIFALAAIMTPPVRAAQTISVTLLNSQDQPISQGPVGTPVIVQITNYPSSDYSFTVTFGTANVGTIETGPTYTIASTLFNVPPSAALGKYTVTVTGSEGETGTATFTVTQAAPIVVTPAPTGKQTGTSSVTPTSSPTGGIPTNYYPYGTGPPSKGTGFWSPLAIGIVAFVLAVACFTTVVFVRRGRQGSEQVSVEDKSSYKPSSSVENTQPYTLRPTVQGASPYSYRSSAQQASPYGYRSSTQQTSTYGYRSPAQQTSPYGYRSSIQQTSPYGYRSSVPPTRSTVPPQFNQTATTRSQSPAHTKVCKHCKRDVREDLRVCPYCYKKL
jgi:hypothetical protein